MREYKLDEIARRYSELFVLTLVTFVFVVARQRWLRLLVAHERDGHRSQRGGVPGASVTAKNEAHWY